MVLRKRFFMARERGTTLVELMVSAVMGAIVIVGVTLMYHASLRGFKGGELKIELQREGAYALETITKKVWGGNELNIGNYSSGINNRVEIQVKGASTTYYRYYWDPADDALKKSVQVGAADPSTPEVIIPNSNNYEVTSLSFQDAAGSNAGVIIKLTLSETVKLVDSVSFSTTAYVRVKK